jgi:uncharacterized protein (DUF1501 family)
MGRWTTDHGTAQVNFVIGNAVKGGMYGTPPRSSRAPVADCEHPGPN